MNPRYDRAIGDWIYHLCDQYEVGNVSEAIALVPARTDTDWFRRTRGYPKCFFFGRLHFSDTENAAPFPSMALYMGRNLRRFARAFANLEIFMRWWMERDRQQGGHRGELDGFPELC